MCLFTTSIGMSVGKYWDEYWNPDGESWQLGRGRTSLLHRTARLAAAGLPGSWQGSLGTSPSETRGQPWGRHGTWRPVGARLAEAGLACQEAGEGALERVPAKPGASLGVGTGLGGRSAEPGGHSSQKATNRPHREASKQASNRGSLKCLRNREFGLKPKNPVEL